MVPFVHAFMVNLRATEKPDTRDLAGGDPGFSLKSMDMTQGKPHLTLQATRIEDLWNIRLFETLDRNLLEFQGVSWDTCIEKFKLFKEGMMKKKTVTKLPLKKAAKKTSKQVHDEAVASVVKALGKMPNLLKEEPDAPANPALIREEWPQYVAKLRTKSDLERRLHVLDEGYKFVRRDWEQPLTKREAAIMFGYSVEGESFADFGALKLVKAFFGKNFVDSSITSTKNRRQIGKALSRFIDSKTFQSPLILNAVDDLNKIEGCWSRLATRLLIFARPDWFVVWNKKSQKWLTTEFHLPLDKEPSANQYLKLIEAIQRRPWWKSSPPEDVEDHKLWQNRVALIDCFAFENYKAEGS